MPMNTQQFLNLYLKKIDRAFFEAWDEEPEQWSKYLLDKDSNAYAEIVQNFAGLGRWTKKDELKNPDQQNFKLADLITTTHTPFATQIVMSREQVDDAKFGEVESMTRDAGHAGRDTIEGECAQVLDNAFTQNQYDGVPLFSNAHPNRGDAGGTQSNLASGALNDANLKQAIVLFRQQKDEAGKQIMSRPKRLIINQSQQFTAATILQSALMSGTANNDKNTLPTLEVVDLNFIASLTAWFIQGDRHKLTHYYRVKPEFKRNSEMEDNGSYVWYGYFRHATAVENWRQMAGSTGV